MSSKVIVRCSGCRASFVRYVSQVKEKNYCTQACFHKNASKWLELGPKLDAMVADGASDEQIAAELGVTPGAVRTRKSRQGHRAKRRRLQDYSTGRLLKALRSKGYHVRLVKA